jgi:polysaccharide export outer membrane protein
VFWKHVAVLIVFPMLFGASAAAQISTPSSDAPITPKSLPGLDDPSVSNAPVDLGTYVIGANDVLNVVVFHDKDWTHLYPVRTDGMITVETFGEMKAEGLTPMQVGKQLTEMLSEKLRDPVVTVGVWQVNSKKYTVTGSVKRSGSFPLVRTTTVFEAITDAGGFQDNFSNERDILILRGTQRLHFSYKDYVKGKNLDKNIPLQNGDTVLVK